MGIAFLCGSGSLGASGCHVTRASGANVGEGFRVRLITWPRGHELSSSPSMGEDSGEGARPQVGKRWHMDASGDSRRHPLIPSVNSGQALAFSRQGRRDFETGSSNPPLRMPR